MSQRPVPRPVAKSPAKPVTKAAPKPAPKTAPKTVSEAAASASTAPQQPPLEQKYEQKLKSVLNKLFNNEQHEELVFTWFLQRKGVHRREVNLVDDRYQAMGMDHREETTEQNIEQAFGCLTALEAEPEQRKVVAEMCEWLRYQGMPPRLLHLYPQELKAVCQPVTAKWTVAELACAVNELLLLLP